MSWLVGNSREKRGQCIGRWEQQVTNGKHASVTQLHINASMLLHADTIKHPRVPRLLTTSVDIVILVH